MYVIEFAKRGLIHTSNFPTLMRHNFICKQAIRQSYLYNDRKGLLPNFKAVNPIEAELHIFSVTCEIIIRHTFTRVCGIYNKHE